MMRFVFFLLFCLAALPAGAVDGYSSVITDLPLMPQMHEDAEAAVVFDTASGRIVETAATTGAAAAEVYAFYADALPALGWQPRGGNSYARDNEMLTITVEGETARFRISPAAR